MVYQSALANVFLSLATGRSVRALANVFFSLSYRSAILCACAGFEAIVKMVFGMIIHIFGCVGREIAMTLQLGNYKVLTFDCYGTLIDWESGIWDALQPLLMSNVRTL